MHSSAGGTSYADEWGARMAEPYDELGQLMAYEAGELDDDQTLELFQSLVNSGLAWKLQGSYGRAAQRYLDCGLISPAPVNA